MQPIADNQDLIERLEALLAAQDHPGVSNLRVAPSFGRDILTALRSYAKEVEAMREALKPFSAVARWDVGANEDDADLWRPAPKYNVAEPIRVGHLRAACAARTPADPA